MTAQNPAPAAVELVRVRKEFGSAVGVADVSLTIGQGEFLTLLGPSGCGKSTLLGMIAGFLTPTAGKIVVDGVDITDVEPYRRDIGMVFQSYALFPHMNVFDNIAFGLRMRKLPKAEIAVEVRRAIAMMKLEGFEQRRVSQLSGGQRQRVGIARALAMEPRLIVADESVSALDVSVQAQVLKLLHDVQQRLQLALIFITHDLRVAAQICDHLLVMHRGRVVEQGPPAQIFDDPQDAYTRQLIAAMPGRGWDPAAAIQHSESLNDAALAPHAS
ncbi:MAG: ABC transporter ATP-binding protein [Achromobacter sp.]|nr:ABC transporter ATP-binding protein [Achromobacter sp.]